MSCCYGGFIGPQTQSNKLQLDESPSSNYLQRFNVLTDSHQEIIVRLLIPIECSGAHRELNSSVSPPAATPRSLSQGKLHSRPSSVITETSSVSLLDLELCPAPRQVSFQSLHDPDP